MSIVSDLREALQDVVAPDLKAVVRGLADLKESVAELKAEMKASNALLRDEMQAGNTRLREEMQTGHAILREEISGVEKRTAERIERVYDAVKISDLTRRNAELEKQLEQLRAPQQH